MLLSTSVWHCLIQGGPCHSESLPWGGGMEREVVSLCHFLPPLHHPFCISPQTPLKNFIWQKDCIKYFSIKKLIQPSQIVTGRGGWCDTQFLLDFTCAKLLQKWFQQELWKSYFPAFLGEEMTDRTTINRPTDGRGGAQEIYPSHDQVSGTYFNVNRMSALQRQGTTRHT